MIQFLVVGVLSSIVIGGASLLWPRFTAQPRPAPLEKIHDIVLTTQFGRNAAETLGVASPSAIVPINPSEIARTAAQTAVTTVEKRVQQVVIENAVKQLSNQINELPPEQKQQIQSIICKP